MSLKARILPTMIAVGYMAKRVATRPSWLKAAHVADVFSVSGCMSPDFADYIRFWKHNGYWLFDSPETIRAVALEHAIDLSGTSLFYYEVGDQEFDEKERRWTSFQAEPTFSTDIIVPSRMNLEGYDIVSFSARTNPEHSPLSCNALAEEIDTNRHCLLDSFERAQQLLNDGALNQAEPGPFRIFAVYSTPWPES